MRSLFTLCIALLAVTVQAQTKTEFDPQLAKQLNADEYGMKSYVMAFLKKGPTPAKDTATAARLQSAHLKNIQRMADEGKLCIAGPFLENTEIRGIYIFNVSSVEEARKLTETDPLIQSGGLIMELHPWYGSAALQQVYKIHNSIAKNKF